MKKLQDSDIFGGTTNDSINSDHFAFRQRLFMNILSVAMVFSMLFGVLHDLDINPITELHANVNYVYSFICLLVLLSLRHSDAHFQLKISIFLIASHLTFTSALINVPDDQFRAIWFFLLVLVAYILGDCSSGIITTGIALITLIVINQLTDLGFSDITFTSIILGLVILGFIAHSFTKRAVYYASLLADKNQLLEKLAKEDPLTGIMNARSYYHIGQQLFELSKRKNQNMTILYIDLDHFKKINDTHGHHSGDRVLIEVTRSILSVLRKSDVLARVGGEEFCILLPETDTKGGKILAEKIRETIQNSPITLNEDIIHPTASIGLAELHKQDNDMNAIQRRADNNLYVAKKNGRNQVIAA